MRVLCGPTSRRWLPVILTLVGAHCSSSAYLRDAEDELFPGWLDSVYSGHSATINAPFWPDFQAENRRLEAPHAHDGTFLPVPNGPSSGGEGEVDEDHVPTQDEIFMLLDELNPHTFPQLPAPISRNQPQRSRPLQQTESNHIQPPQPSSPPAPPPRMRNRIPKTVVDEHFRAVQSKLRMEYMKGWKSGWERQHDPLPILSKTRGGEDGFTAIKIANRTGTEPQRLGAVESRYRKLVARIYQCHAADQTTRPPGARAMPAVRAVVARLNQDLFAPSDDTGVPLWGKTSRFLRGGFANHRWNSAQLLLARYFACEPEHPGLRDQVARFLIGAAGPASPDCKPCSRQIPAAGSPSAHSLSLRSYPELPEAQPPRQNSRSSMARIEPLYSSPVTLCLSFQSMQHLSNHRLCPAA
ncbi:hypothetical protein PtA15_4A596 [Puccinia triticina]|uniref:Uncharacterized protein n=1 Tax=Puccinia triticina TaxID=208348 RepID=A0ABY7CGD1_9BASI|nr:uncharacterized protein PtA15_4A596 [Puccinia triticina]WAQ84145.1 hypothetical protein PtA15_4A596 [Puccinia triticina]